MLGEHNVVLTVSLYHIFYADYVGTGAPVRKVLLAKETALSLAGGIVHGLADGLQYGALAAGSARMSAGDGDLLRYPAARGAGMRHAPGAA